MSSAEEEVELYLKCHLSENGETKKKIKMCNGFFFPLKVVGLAVRKPDLMSTKSQHVAFNDS